MTDVEEQSDVTRIVPINQDEFLSLKDHNRNVGIFQKQCCMSQGIRDMQVPITSKEIWKWDKGVYRRLTDLEEKEIANNFLREKKQWTKDQMDSIPYYPNKSRIGEFLEFVKINFQVPNEIHKANTWLFDPIDPPTPSMIMPFKNGLFDMEKYMRKRQMGDCLIDHTPRFFNSWIIPFDLKVNLADIHRPTIFLNALSQMFDETWGKNGDEDGETIQLIFEYLGYCLTDQKKYHKMLLLIGESGAGKSALQKLFIKVVGKENCINPHMATFDDKNGMFQWLHKRLAVFGDAYIPKKSQLEIESTILKIVGDDGFTVPLKYANESIEAEINAKIIMASNEVPNFKSKRDGFGRRSLVIYFGKKVKQDVNFEKSLEKEIPLIFIEAIKALARLEDRGEFVQPKSSEFLLKRIQRGQNTISTFLNERCIFDPMLEIPRGRLIEEYKNWCAENEEEMEQGHFKSQLLDICGNRVRIGRSNFGTRPHTYKGIGIKQQATDTEE